MIKFGIRIIVLILLLMPLINCSAQEKDNVAYIITPLGKNETLDYKKEQIKDTSFFKMTIYKISGGKRIEIKEIDYVSWCDIKLISHSKKMLYMVPDTSEISWGNKAYILDGIKGKTYFIGNNICIYDITDDGRYLCYEKDLNIKDNLTIPGIEWDDLKTGKKRIYDFSNTFLKNEWGAGVNIIYIPEREVFNISFFMEDLVFSKGYISVEGGNYHEYKDAIATGYIKSNKAKLWQSPNRNGKLVVVRKYEGKDYYWSVTPGYSEVDIIGKTQNKVKIGKMYNYWYKVRTFSMYEGWVFGEYITLEK